MLRSHSRSCRFAYRWAQPNCRRAALPNAPRGRRHLPHAVRPCAHALPLRARWHQAHRSGPSAHVATSSALPAHRFPRRLRARCHTRRRVRRRRQATTPATAPIVCGARVLALHVVELEENRLELGGLDRGVGSHQRVQSQQLRRRCLLSIDAMTSDVSRYRNRYDTSSLCCIAPRYSDTFTHTCAQSTVYYTSTI